MPAASGVVARQARPPSSRCLVRACLPAPVQQRVRQALPQNTTQCHSRDRGGSKHEEWQHQQARQPCWAPRQRPWAPAHRPQWTASAHASSSRCPPLPAGRPHTLARASGSSGASCPTRAATPAAAPAPRCSGKGDAVARHGVMDCGRAGTSTTQCALHTQPVGRMAAPRALRQEAATTRVKPRVRRQAAASGGRLLPRNPTGSSPTLQLVRSIVEEGRQLVAAKGCLAALCSRVLHGVGGTLHGDPRGSCHQFACGRIRGVPLRQHGKRGRRNAGVSRCGMHRQASAVRSRTRRACRRPPSDPTGQSCAKRALLPAAVQTCSAGRPGLRSVTGAPCCSRCQAPPVGGVEQLAKAGCCRLAAWARGSRVSNPWSQGRRRASPRRGTPP